MLDKKTLQKLGGWEGYRLERAVWPEEAGGTLELHLKPTRQWMHCERILRDTHFVDISRIRRSNRPPVPRLQPVPHANRFLGRLRQGTIDHLHGQGRAESPRRRLVWRTPKPT